jgi:hypothetical protein
MQGNITTDPRQSVEDVAIDTGTITAGETMSQAKKSV